MTDEPLFDFAVPDDLLPRGGLPGQGHRRRRRSGGHARHRGGQAAPADRHPQELGLRPPRPSHGRGARARHLRQRHQPHREEPRDLLPHVERLARHGGLHRPGVTAPLGRPAGGLGRPRQPQGGGRRRPADLRRVRLAHGALAQRVVVRLPLPGRLRGDRRQQHGPQLLPGRRLPDGRARPDLQLAQPVGPAVADRGNPHFRLRGDGGAQLALRPACRAARACRSGSRSSRYASPEGRQREQPHPQGVRHGPAQSAGEGAARPARLGRDAAAACALPVLRARRRRHSRLRRHRAPLFGNLFFIDKFHLDTASRSEVYAIIGLAASSGSRWPTSSGTATSAGRRSDRS